MTEHGLPKAGAETPLGPAIEVQAAGATASTRPRYCAFLSYSHADTKWARWLMRRLETFAVPARFRGREGPIGQIGRRIAPVFRDRDELATTGDLGESIRRVLGESAALIVICSPASAASRWVREEILTFKRLHGESNVFAFIVGGEPKAVDLPEDCFSPALRYEAGLGGERLDRPAELVGADARPQGDGPRMAFLRLVAGLLGVGFDELRQRELQRRNRRLTLIAAASLAGLVLATGLAAYAWRARNDAQRRQDEAEDVLSFMLGDYRGELKKLGRLDLLNRVGDKATTYFDSLDQRDLTDNALQRQAMSLRQIGEVRMEQRGGRLTDALQSFMGAHRRASALSEKHPENADMLFERAQAEFWIGYVYRQQHDLLKAKEWLTRYYDSAALLTRIEPGTRRAQLESIYGHHNLAVLEHDLGQLAEARRDFAAELEIERSLQSSSPSREMEGKIADALSWLGSIAEERGELGEAGARFDEEIAALQALHRAEPGTAQYAYNLANAEELSAMLLAVRGDRTLSDQRLLEAQAEVSRLLAIEPANRRWVLLARTIDLQAIAQHPESWRFPSGAFAVDALRREIETLARAEPNDLGMAKLLGRAWRLESAVLLAAGDSRAVSAAERAVNLSEGLAQAGPTADLRGACAQAHLIRARLFAAGGKSEAARRDCDRALAILPSGCERSHNWQLLDPFARASALLGRRDRFAAVASRLALMGYTPAEPWPEALFPPLQTTSKAEYAHRKDQR